MGIDIRWRAFIFIAMNNTPTPVGVLGATGYTGRELIRLLAGHSGVRLHFATSENDAGSSLRRIARHAPDIPLVSASDADLSGCGVVFSCLPHGESAIWASHARDAGARVIDLSADLRVVGEDTQAWARSAVYGLPELHRERIRGAEIVANPGCYPTAALLALAPLLREGLISGPVIVNAASGVTGAGRSPSREMLFAEVAEDFRAYAVGNAHRHLAEMRDQADALSAVGSPEIVFTPHLLPVRRGILETIYAPLSEPLRNPERLWESAYEDEPFVEVLRGRTPSLANVVGTNRVAIGVTPVAGVSSPMLVLVAAIDNLLKGAAGQAVQNLNLMLGRDEGEALP